MKSAIELSAKNYLHLTIDLPTRGQELVALRVVVEDLGVGRDPDPGVPAGEAELVGAGVQPDRRSRPCVIRPETRTRPQGTRSRLRWERSEGTRPARLHHVHEAPGIGRPQPTAVP